MIPSRSTTLGTIVGGAVGDAMGAPFEGTGRMTSHHLNLSFQPTMSIMDTQVANTPSAEFRTPIITPFVIPTVLAAIYCVIQHRSSWVDAVTSAVKFGGDVDTLGATVGALAGAFHGMEGIPTNLISDLQDTRSIQVLASRYHLLIDSRLGNCGIRQNIG